MSKWQNIRKLAEKDDQVWRRVLKIYEQHDFNVLQTRAQLAEWFECQYWDAVAFDDMEQCERKWKQFSEFLLEDLLQNLEKCVEEEIVMMKKIALQNEYQFLQRFRSNSLDFVKIVQRCMAAEITLLESMTVEKEPLSHAKNTNNAADAKQNFRHKIDALLLMFDKEVKTKFQEAQKIVDDYKCFTKEFQMEVKKLKEFMHDIDTRLHSQNTSPESIQKLKQNKNLILESEKTKCASLMQYQKDLAIKMHDASGKFDEVLKQSWNLLEELQTNQRLQITCMVPVTDSEQIDDLEMLFRQINKQLILLIRLTEMATAELDRVKDTLKDTLTLVPSISQLKAKLKSDLRRHLEYIFIVDRQPNWFNKITLGQGKKMFMSVRILGGEAFAVMMNSPKVIARIYSENDGQLKAAYDYKGSHENIAKIPKGNATVYNGVERFTEQSLKGVVACFNYQLKDVSRTTTEKIAKGDRVTHVKYAFVFYTVLTLFDEKFPIKTLSVPVCLDSSNSQEVQSLGALIWEAVFPDPSRDQYSFKDLPVVLFQELCNILNALSVRRTSKELTEEQLCYLAQRLLNLDSMPSFKDAREMKVTKEQFLKENLPGVKFSFWTWVIACLNLIKNRLKSEWKDGLIFGFMSREMTKRLLMDKDHGTCLIRFSDKKIEKSLSGEVPGCLTVAFVYENPEKAGTKEVELIKKGLSSDDLHKNGLTNILEGMFCKIFEDKGIPLFTNILKSSKEVCAIEQAFEQYNAVEEQEDERNDGYAKTKPRTEVLLQLCKMKKAKGKARSFDNVVSPESVCSPSASSDVSSIDQRMANMDMDFTISSAHSLPSYGVSPENEVPLKTINVDELNAFLNCDEEMQLQTF